MNKESQVQGGNFYVLEPDGRLVPTAPRPDAVLWVCRRVRDFPAGEVPVGAAIAFCSECGQAVAHGSPPSPSADPPKVCMQCVRITPLPITQSREE